MSLQFSSVQLRHSVRAFIVNNVMI